VYIFGEISLLWEREIIALLIFMRIGSLRFMRFTYEFMLLPCPMEVFFFPWFGHGKNKTPVSGSFYFCFGFETETGTYFGYFSRQTFVQPCHSKGLGESFLLMSLNIGLSWKIREYCVFWLLSKIDQCSAISFKRSRRERSIDVAQHRSTRKTTKIRTTPFLVPLAFPKRGVLFSLWCTRNA